MEPIDGRDAGEDLITNRRKSWWWLISIPVVGICAAALFLLCAGLFAWQVYPGQGADRALSESEPSPAAAEGTSPGRPSPDTAPSPDPQFGAVSQEEVVDLQATATISLTTGQLEVPAECGTGPTPDQEASHLPLLGPISFATGQNETGWPLDAGQQFAADSGVVQASFGFAGMRDGMAWDRVWYFGEQELLRASGQWDAGARGQLTVHAEAGEGGFAPGQYRLEIFGEGKLLGWGSFIIAAADASTLRPVEVAYTTLEDRMPRINLLDLASGKAEPLLMFARYPAWSGDATGLLFRGEPGIEAGTPGLWVLNASQGKTFQLNEDVSFQNIAWSPHRTFMATSVTEEQGPRLRLLDLTRNEMFDGPAGQDPAWSPEGHRLAYRGCSEGSWHISTVQVISNVFDYDTVQPITVGDDSQPAWSRDGQLIAFVRSEAGNQDIYTVTPNGDDLTRLTNDPAINIAPAWTPDNHLLFWSLRDGRWGIYIMDADGSDRRLLIDTPAALSWQPDRLALTSDVALLEPTPVPPSQPRVQVPPGRGLLVVSNRQNSDEMTFTVDNIEHKISPYQVKTLPLKPGNYTWTASWPAKVSRTGLADIVVGQVSYPVVER